jgi:hypothetical protein
MPRLRDVDEAVVRAQQLIEDWDAELRRELPAEPGSVTRQPRDPPPEHTGD